MNCLLNRWRSSRLLLLLIVSVGSFSAIDDRSAFATGTPDPSVAEQDPDFAIQGEYVGDNRAMQVIAAGDGDFDLVIYEGGLPGAGAQGEPRRIESDIDTVEELIESMGMKKVERKSPTLGREAPDGAIVLFDGSPESVEKHWQNGRLSDDGLLMEGTRTKQRFRDYSLHVEFRTPYAPNARGQKRGNSGIYHQGRFETQILDSFGLEGLDNEAGGIYTVSSPSVNACFPPLQWQTYDVDFTAARYDADGKKTSNARLTVRLNGIMVQNDVEVPGPTRAASLKSGPEPGPIVLQNHSDPVRFRNIWVMPRDAEREAARPIVAGFERFVGTESTSIADAGEVLIASLACGACHAYDESLTPSQRGPDLSEVAGRVRADAMVSMIADPHQTKMGTTMPDPWPNADAATRQRNANAVASYLTLRGKGRLADRVVSQRLADQGEKLYHEIGCVACHGPLGKDAGKTPFSTTVPLGQTHRKYTVPSLIHFLQNCTDIRGGSRMPAMVGSAQEVAAVAAYLTAETSVGENEGLLTRSVYRGKWKKLPNFDELEPVATSEVGTLKIDDIKPGNFFGVVFEANISIENDGDYTFTLSSDDGSALQIGEHRLAHDGIHASNSREATFSLKAGVYPVRIEYFDGGGQIGLSVQMSDPRLGRDDIAAWITDGDEGGPVDLLPSVFQPDETLVSLGRELFQSAQCVNCHAFDDDELGDAKMALPLDQLVPSKGCLADDVKSPAVDYGLGATQLTAIESALDRRRSGESTEPDDTRRVHATLMALNCYACHDRESIGGVETIRGEFFHSTVPEMGLEGRLPPSLTGVADKLNDRYLKDVLEEGANARGYMHTRMPAFGYEALSELHAALVKLDRSDEVETYEATKTLQQVQIDGRKLCGNAGLSCIKCHSYNGNDAGGLGAIDMLMMPQRLRHEWFQRYLQDPTKYRPGTRMPNSFVDGRSALVDIDGGDPARQIDAIWQYLLMGTDAKEPQGLNQKAIVLTAAQRPRIYRNFFTGVSPRGIGVGYPEEVNVIWDAEQMSLARVWKNGFVDASKHWRGRGQGSQQPLGDAVVSVDAGSPLAVLSGAAESWPKESGRDRGYQMRGYRLDKEGNPKFRYSIGEIAVEDYPVPDENGLRREFVIENPEAPSDGVLVWRIAQGKIEPVDEGYRIDGRLVVSVDGVDVQLIDVDGSQSLRAVIPAGTATKVTQVIRW
ncbi:family 16 glycoside hydrolase [Rhodopirellula sallentina]|uniref:Secreted protein containing DUF1080 n=1 Tax=Rhodopirellula sallentina SM41 TaxID=1263870 RepID=M5U971_9BACT|nr:family 16 glycoside hydrolase [Rhodopirellula sallentina]EMI57980.1 secreted protein containing DUF1080 [Rhodopirellula sallentina SM41]